MPLVFVHGVATRKSADYDRIVKLRDSLFKEVTLKGIRAPQPSTVLNPYWGNSGVTFAWNHASVPGKKNETFGSTLEAANDLLINTADQLPGDPDTTLITIAKTSPEAAIDTLFGMTAFDDTGADPAALAKLATRALAYVRRHPTMPWLAEVKTDTVFIDRLRLEMEKDEPPAATGTETFGFGDAISALKTAATRVAQVAQDLISRTARAKTEPLITTLRPTLDTRVTTFVGDALVYLKTRGTPASPGEIVITVGEAIAAAQQGKPDRHGDPIIIVAHSMGGNIVYDLLTHYRTDLFCDVLVTVGSQVALFEEMKLYGGSDPSLEGPQASVPKPPNVGHWINVFDINDVLAYAVGTVFKDANDYEFDTGKTVLGAHSAYFLRPSFHERLNARLKAVLP